MTVINAGTISVDANSTSVTGSGTNWKLTIGAGDLLVVGQAFGLVASVEDNDALTLVGPWAFDEATDSLYFIAQLGVSHDTIETNRLLRVYTEALQAGKMFRPDATGTFAERMDYDEEAKGYFYLQVDVTPHIMFTKLSDGAADWNAGSEWPIKGGTGAAAVVTENGSNGDFDVGGSLSEQGHQVYHKGNAGELMDKPNLLINGGFNVWQRGTSFSFGAGGYAADRWQIYGNSTVARVADTPDASTQYAMSVTTDSWNNGILQIIENGANLLSEKTVTISAWVKGPAGKTARTEIGWGPVGALFTFTGNWQRVEAELDIAASVAANSPGGHLYLHIVRAGVGTIVAGETVIISNACLCAVSSSGSDPFQPRNFQQEYFYCQRYFQATCPYGQEPYNYAPGSGNNSIYEGAGPSTGSITVIRFPAPMRSNPTITIFDGDGASGKISVHDGAAWVGNYGYTGAFGLSDKGFSLQQNNAVYGVTFDYVVEAEL